MCNEPALLSSLKTGKIALQMSCNIPLHMGAILCTKSRIMNIVKHEITQRQALRNAMDELKIKSKRLEDAYIKLQDAAIDIEEMAVYSERNKIAREIHDTVGHTLTTALIEIEAVERLLERNPELSAVKIGLAKCQIRQGLRNIRESVGMLNSGREMMDFASSMKLLMDETAKHGEIFFRYEISEMPNLSRQQEKALYRALQEGITNGIKHGGSTAFVFRLRYEDGSVRFFLEDNGKGCDRIVPGFGLAAMEQRVREVGGMLNVSSAANEGFRISISIPVREGDKSDESKDHDSGRPTADAGRAENNIGV